MLRKRSAKAFCVWTVGGAINAINVFLKTHQTEFDRFWGACSGGRYQPKSILPYWLVPVGVANHIFAHNSRCLWAILIKLTGDIPLYPPIIQTEFCWHPVKEGWMVELWVHNYWSSAGFVITKQVCECFQSSFKHNLTSYSETFVKPETRPQLLATYWAACFGWAWRRLKPLTATCGDVFNIRCCLR